MEHTTLIISEFIDHCQTRLHAYFASYFEKKTPAPLLQKAMKYAVMNGGKRLRPLLVYAVGYTFNADENTLDVVAGAVELIHSYSLVHDDLPAMDNADARRGNPSCHKAFNEAIAILTGDALQPLAFEWIASSSDLNTDQRVKMITLLSQAAGINGMAAGQAMDIEGVSSLESLLEMYALKTGALFTASIQLGAIAANIKDPLTLFHLDTYAKKLGLAFQIQDDLFDIESTPDLIGKPTQLDNHHRKMTYPVFTGTQKAHETVKQLYQDALDAIAFLGEKGIWLRRMTEILSDRQK